MTGSRDAVDGGDDGELFLERRRSEALVFDDGRLKTADFNTQAGFGLRGAALLWKLELPAYSRGK